jgi:hypothetical protein
LVTDKCSIGCRWREKKELKSIQNGTQMGIRMRKQLDRKGVVGSDIDCSLFLIGPGALLLVVFHLHAFPVLVLWVELGKGNQNSDATKLFAGSHTEHGWRRPRQN